MTNLAAKKLEEMTISPAGKVIKAEDYQFMVQGRQLLAEIERRAEALYRREKDAAYQAAEERVQQSASQQMLDVASASIEYLSRVEKRLVKIVIESVERIIGELEDTEATVKMIKTALYQMRNESRVTLRVSFDEAPAIKKRIKDIIVGYPNIDFVDVVVDQAIVPGTCHLTTPLGSIKTGLEVQIKTLEQALLKNFSSQTE